MNAKQIHAYLFWRTTIHIDDGLLVSNNADFMNQPYLWTINVIRLIKNPEFHKRTKHIDIKFHFIRQKFAEGLFHLEYIETNLQLADILTKALNRQKFENMRKIIGISELEWIQYWELTNDELTKCNENDGLWFG